MKVSGEPVAHLVASTSGTDSDWVVKVIDVFPDGVAGASDTGGVFAGVLGTATNMAGYELPISTDIFRGRYRTSFEKPSALKAGEPLEFTFGLPEVNHTFLPGHRIMVQVQSTLFPLYDRNPQTFVPNIFEAKPGDFVKATQKVWHTKAEASYVSSAGGAGAVRTLMSALNFHYAAFTYYDELLRTDDPHRTRLLAALSTGDPQTALGLGTEVLSTFLTKVRCKPQFQAGVRAMAP